MFLIVSNRRSWSQPFSMAPNEPGAASLKGLIMLSSNEECLSKLIQYICIPKFSTNLIMMARSPRSSYGMLANVASLMQNIYEVHMYVHVYVCVAAWGVRIYVDMFI